MDAATEKKPTARFSLLLAGLQAGMMGTAWMLTWLGMSSVWQRRSFWTPENLMASFFHGKAAIHEGFSFTTISGAALYFVIYGVLGALFAAVLRDRMPRSRLLLASLIFGLSWYYLSFRVIWRAVSPLIALLHVEQTTMLGHLIYGMTLSRYPAYLARQTPDALQGPAPPEVVDIEPAPRAE
jgi:hypothetical protein